MNVPDLSQGRRGEGETTWVGELPPLGRRDNFFHITLWLA